MHTLIPIHQQGVRRFWYHRYAVPILVGSHPLKERHANGIACSMIRAHRARRIRDADTFDCAWLVRRHPSPIDRWDARHTVSLHSGGFFAPTRNTPIPSCILSLFAV